MNENKTGMQKVWTVATGNVDPFVKGSREAVDFIKNLDGFVGVHPEYPHGTLWLFDSLNNAKIARNRIKGQGAAVGTHICEAEVDYDKSELFIIKAAD